MLLAEVSLESWLTLAGAIGGPLILFCIGAIRSAAKTNAKIDSIGEKIETADKQNEIRFKITDERHAERHAAMKESVDQLRGSHDELWSSHHELRGRQDEITNVAKSIHQELVRGRHRDKESG